MLKLRNKCVPLFYCDSCGESVDAGTVLVSLMINRFHGLIDNSSATYVWAFCCICVLLSPPLSQAKSPNEPSYNYKLFCQGCHLPDGTGVLGEVPTLVNNLSRYIKTPEGREFVVQVPGVMHALLTDAEVAELARITEPVKQHMGSSLDVWASTARTR